ncbi:MAG: hypothetical protein ACPLY7_02025, partial [Microgenomates group bacterium]
FLKILGKTIAGVTVLGVAGCESKNGQTPTPAFGVTPTSMIEAPVSTATATATKTATAVATATVTATETPVVFKEEKPEETLEQEGWQVEIYKNATSQMRDWVKELKNPVTDWSEFPNVDFPKYGFKAENGVEYGMAESAYCQQGQTCDVNVPAMHYRLITGDYNIPGIDKCLFDKDGAGCSIALFNVGNVTAMFRDSSVDYGFTVSGRYFNGEAMPETIRALLSNAAYNMLNEEGGVNKGANCSSPAGCAKVRLAFVILSGNELLVKGVTSLEK